MTLPLSSPFTTNSLVTKAQLDQLVASINALYQALPRAKATTTSGQTVATSTTVIVTGFTSVYAVGGMTVSTNGITVPVNGDYDVLVNTGGGGAAATRRAIHVLVNGADLTVPEVFGIPGIGTFGPTASTVLRLNAGDKVQVNYFQDSGASISLPFAMLAVALRGAN